MSTDNHARKALMPARTGALSRVPVITTLPSRTTAVVKRSGRFGARHLGHVAAGFTTWGHRFADAATHGPIREKIRAARATGDVEALAEWTDRLRVEKDHRLSRLKDIPAEVIGIVWAVGSALAVALVVLLLLAGSAQILPGGMTGGDVFRGVWRLYNAAAIVIEALLYLAVWGAVPWLLVSAWFEGRRRAGALGWVSTADTGDVDTTIDESAIARALSGLRIPAINDHLREGAALQYVQIAHRDGRGVAATVRLPLGAAAEKIVTRRSDLAAGLFRSTREVWPSVGEDASLLGLWVADKGALAEGAGPHPMLDDGDVDIFRGVPFGRTLRGQPVVAPILERNTLTGGMPGQGKSSAARVIMAGAALDPTAELRIWVPDINFDFQAFEPRCSRFVVGAEDTDIEAILADLRELHTEVQTRGELLVKHEQPAVTRRLASAGVGLHPLVCLLEEAHVAIQDKTHGKDIAQLLVDIVRLGRKRGIHLIVSTQAPTRDSMPRDVTRNCSNGIAFAVGDHVANDALLGQGAYRAGHRATELIPGTDRGTAIVKGFSGQRSEAVQTYYLDVSKDNDQVTPIITRALAAIERRGRGVPGTGRRKTIESRDLLTDLDEVLGDEPVKAADVPALLREHAPNWVPYRALTGQQLRDRLAELGIRVPTTGRRYPIDPAVIRSAIALRSNPAEVIDIETDDETNDGWEESPVLRLPGTQ